MVGRWLKPVALVAKQLAARLVFLSTLIILVPLAVLNRQSVSISFNPMDLLRDEPQGRLEMPLFIALFALFILGLLSGWLMGRFGKNRRQALPGPSHALSPSSSRPMRAVVIDKAPDQVDAETETVPLSVTASAKLDDASVQQDLETGEESDEAHAR